MKLILRIVSGSKYGQMIVVEPHQVRTIGRSSAAQFTFDDEHMSGTHMEVENLGEQALVRDRNSRNRTWLNKQPITTANLKNGDILRAGKTIFSVELAASSPPHVPAAKVEPPPNTKRERVTLRPQALPPELSPPKPSLPTKEITPEASKAIEFVEAVEVVAPRVADDLPSTDYQTPISDSVSWSAQLPNPDSVSIVDERRFRQMERIGDFQTVFNLRSIMTELRKKKSVRVIVHFSKIGMLNPSLASAVPMFTKVPGALEHWPVSIGWHDWESEKVQLHATNLCASDALMIIISEISADTETDLQKVGQEGIPGYCQPDGFLGWCWPSAFIMMVQTHGLRRWMDGLGPTVECVLMYKPTHPDTLVAFAAESISDDLLELGFTTSY